MGRLAQTLGLAIQMSTIPRLTDLPPFMSTLGWAWERIDRPGHPSDGFWIGTDLSGNRWITKLRGGFYAYREILFAAIAQKMGWSCQSTIYIKIDPVSAITLNCKVELTHAAHWYMEEHASSPCKHDCALRRLNNNEIINIEEFGKLEILNIIDLPKSDLAVYIFGANEPCGRFFTRDHQFIIIDSEQMFSSGPCQFQASPWLKTSDGSKCTGGLSLAMEVCENILSLNDEFLNRALSVPEGINIKMNWQIAPKLKASIAFARAFVQGCEH